MGFEGEYFGRVKTFGNYLDNYDIDTDIVVIIPVYNEPDVINTALSLNLNKTRYKTTVIFLINSSEKTDEKIVLQNRQTARQLRDFALSNQNKFITYKVINIEDVDEKIHGVGFARKVAMDEALKIFVTIKKPNGIIVSLDADTTVAQNYLDAIGDYFSKEDVCGANIYFEHQIEGDEFNDDIYRAITIYELYLRYYVQALRIVGYPYAYHTIGSAFAVTAKTYARLGGMVMNKAGEDFYFLQKLFTSCKFGEINNTTVYPSPRISDRIIFGTGVVVDDIIKKYNFNYFTYDLNSFLEIKSLIDNLIFFYKGKNIAKFLSNPLQEFLNNENWQKKIEEIKKNTSNYTNFEKRFYHWFNPLKVLRFLNFSHQKFYQKQNVTEMVIQLISDFYEKNITEQKKLIIFLRKLQSIDD